MRIAQIAELFCVTRALEFAFTISQTSMEIFRWDIPTMLLADPNDLYNKWLETPLQQRNVFQLILLYDMNPMNFVSSPGYFASCLKKSSKCIEKIVRIARSI